MTRDMIYGPSNRLIDLGPDRENIVPIAQDIALHRGRVVAETLFHLAAIRSLHPDCKAARNAVVECCRAHVQTSSAQCGQEAAHLLPGQILVNGAPVWQRATTRDATIASDVLRLEQQTMMCFALTNVLPALFNRADSAAEGRGEVAATQRLKPLFGSVVRELWRASHVRAECPLHIDVQATLAALQRWFTEISQVYDDAAGRKAERGRLEEARVLHTYAESFRIANPSRFVHAHAPQIYQRYASV